LPLLLIHSWGPVTDHALTGPEKAQLRQRSVDAALTLLEQQAAGLTLALDKKRLQGPLPSTEPDGTQKALDALASQEDDLRAGRASNLDAPTTLPFRRVWAKDKDSLPWPRTDGPTLAAQTAAWFAVTGSFRLVAGYLSVHVELYSALEGRVLSVWDGRFAPDEASDRMTEAADSFREILLGRPWAGLSVEGGTSDTRVKVAGVWHPLPWSSDDLQPGSLEVVISQPGLPDSQQSITLPTNGRVSLPWGPATTSPDKIVLETEPPGVSLYLDSQYLGPSPQTVPRPRTTARVRAQAPGWQTAAWEIGPKTASPSRYVLQAPRALPSVQDTKDRFYFSLAAFSASLTATSFLGAWSTEQLELADAYYTAGSASGLNTAYTRYQWVTGAYAAGVVLTSGIFVWMMFELGDYLAAAQASLP